MLNKLIVVKLINGSEIVGILKKEYSLGGIVLGNVMELKEMKDSLMMRAFLLSNQEDLKIELASIVTYAEAIPSLQEVYLESEQYWPVNAYKIFKMEDPDTKRTFN